MGRVTSSIQGGKFDPRSVFMGAGAGYILRIRQDWHGRIIVVLVDDDRARDKSVSWKPLKTLDVNGFIRALNSLKDSDGYHFDFDYLIGAIKKKKKELEFLISAAGKYRWDVFEIGANSAEQFETSIESVFRAESDSEIIAFKEKLLKTRS